MKKIKVNQAIAPPAVDLGGLQSELVRTRKVLRSACQAFDRAADTKLACQAAEAKAQAALEAGFRAVRGG